ncbi:MAG: hypothetical protein J7647_30950 [Cyanobacteria bacterium SBLK]|nr:hypothetical protein [Cyanobacteria bacterium SBLK]
MNIQERAEYLKAAWVFTSYSSDMDELYDRQSILRAYLEEQQRTDIQKWCPFTPGDLVIDNNNRKGVVVGLVAGYHTIKVYFEGKTKAESIALSLLSSLEKQNVFGELWRKLSSYLSNNNLRSQK